MLFLERGRDEMKIWKRWVAVALAVALIGTGNTKAATTAYQLSVPIGVSEEYCYLWR